jgi:RecB family exonuclease
MTSRRITLTAAPGLRALHRALADACAAADAALSRATVVLVPTRAAASQLRRTLENLWLLDEAGASARAAVFPEILTRADWYGRFDPLDGPRRLSEIERETLLSAAAREVARAGTVPPFRLRPGLVAGMLAFYDSLRRQQKTVADFERLVVEDLEPRAEFDRGAERLLRQTRFLVAAFVGFESRMDGCGGVDEHALRQRAIESDRDHGVRRVVVATGDRASDPSGGLYPADFDFLVRLPRLESIDIVATRSALLAGLGERVRRLVPGIEETAVGGDEPSPALLAPDGEPARLVHVSRDREEELRQIARQIKAERGTARHVAVVFRRPLPYVYLATTVFESAGVAYQAADALPLAAEPFAAALDVVVAAVTNDFARVPLVQLLRSPHFVFGGGEREPGAGAVDALDRALAESGYLGDAARLVSFAESAAGPAAVAARAATAAVRELLPLRGRAPVSSHLETLLAFVRGHERREARAATDPRRLRARTAVVRLLEEMRLAALAHDDPPVRLRDLSASIRRWIEAQTFTPARGGEGIQLADAQSARYGDFDRVHLAGLVAGDWPESAARNIFYPSFLLSRLGWPSESDRLVAERAAFADLLRLARDRVSVSSFQLEDDAIVEPSPLVDEVERAALPAATGSQAKGLRVFADEALTAEPVDSAPLPASAAEWARLRAWRSPAAQPQFHGQAGVEGARAPSRGFTVTGIDRYLECPFKYFAATVLGLPEDPADEPGMSPRERGRFVHDVFEAFFREWQARGGEAVTAERLGAARALFAEVAESRLAKLPPSEAALERMRLLGSVASPGLGEVALAAEAVRPTPVAERLLEYAFEGEFEFAAGDERRTVKLRGKADRVDLLTSGEFRVIDYKLGRAPEDSIQLPVYATCLTQHFEAQGRARQVGEALYIAFGERDRAAKAVIERAEDAAAVIAAAHERVIRAVDAIARGEFPARPASARSCTYCPYAAVCREPEA